MKTHCWVERMWGKTKEENVYIRLPGVSAYNQTAKKKRKKKGEKREKNGGGELNEN